MTRKEEITQVATEYNITSAFSAGGTVPPNVDFINGAEWSDNNPSDENILKFINKTENDETVLNALWNDNKNKVIDFFNKKGYGVYNETILKESIKDEKKELTEITLKWFLDNAATYFGHDAIYCGDLAKDFREEIKKHIQ